IELETAAIERRVRGTDAALAGTVRVTAGDGLTNYVLVPALPRLRARHPDLRVDLVGELRVVDLARREADVALRLVRPPGPSLIARRLPALAMGLFASAGYLRDRPPPTAPRDLATHDWLAYTEEATKVPAFAWLRRHVPPAREVLHATTTTTLVQACAAGLG